MYEKRVIVYFKPEYPFLIYLCIIIHSLTLLYIGLVLCTLYKAVTIFLQMIFCIPHKYLYSRILLAISHK